MINIYVQCDNKNDATSWYRAWGTFRDMENRYPIKFHNLIDAYPKHPTQKNRSYLDWTKAQYIDVAFFQRSSGNAIEYARGLKAANIPIWYDLDDNLWEIPDTYPVKKFYPQKVLDSVVEFLEISTWVSVSTQSIADYLLEKFNIKAHVINNGIDFVRYPIQPFNKVGPTLWRGSNTHMNDLSTYKEDIERLSTEGLISWGYDPTKSAPFIKVEKHINLKPVEPLLYFNLLKGVLPSRLLVPLCESKFNEGKSNIAWLEATMAGAVVFSNQWGEFKDKGFKLTDAPSLEDMQKEHEASVLLAIEQYSLSTLNDQRIKMLTNENK
jgi:hypothetical protein